MSALIVDTSVWVESLRGRSLTELEAALREGRVLLPPLVAAELLSASPLDARRRRNLESFLRDLPLHPTPFEHWSRVGALRSHLARRGLAVSVPDAHVAQCALDVDGLVWSRDKIFQTMATRIPLRLMTG